jgi:parallel beta-helix repeat protein
MASNYYFSNLGNNENSGLSPDHPWQTLDVLESLIIDPGDKILLKHGDTFRGIITAGYSGTPDHPITISSWGDGEKPVMSGSVRIFITGSYGESGYKCRIDSHVKGVFVNNRWLHPARYPSTGFFGIDGGDKKRLKDRELLLQDIDCSGATAHIRAVNWQYEIARVARHGGDTLFFETDMLYQCNKDYGYFLDNKLEFMTEPGEWFYDNAEKTLYFIPPEDCDGDMIIEACVYDTGIQLMNSGFLLVDGIKFENYFLAGISGKSGSSNNVIRNCEFNRLHQDGISLESGTGYYLITNNEISDIKGRGIACLDTRHSTIQNNYVHRVGLFPGYGFDGVNSGTGIAVLKTELIYAIKEDTLKKLSETVPLELIGQLRNYIDLPFPDEKFLISALENFVAAEYRGHIPAIAMQVRNELVSINYESENIYIGYNKIESTGLHGIRLDGKNHLCEYNCIIDSLLFMNDGSSIYSWAQNYDYSAGSIIRHNIIQNSVGNTIATPDFHRFAHGIYIDNKCRAFTVENNIITGTTWGILINDEARDHTITGNIIFDNDVGLAFSEYFMPGSLHGCRATDNILFARHRNQRALFIESRISPQFDPVFTDNNFYGSSYYTFPIRKLSFRENHRVWEEFDLVSWQKETGKDGNSSFFAPPDPEARPRRSHMIINDSNEIRIFRVNNAIRDHYDIYGNKLGDEVKVEAFSAMIIIED